MLSRNSKRKSHKIIITVTAAIICAALAGAPAFAVYAGEDYESSESDFVRELSYGMRGADVTQLQLYLEDLGYLDGSAYIRGSFGDSTYYAVEAFQGNNGLSVTGDADWAMLDLLVNGYAYSVYESYNANDSQAAVSYDGYDDDYTPDNSGSAGTDAAAGSDTANGQDDAAYSNNTDNTNDANSPNDANGQTSPGDANSTTSGNEADYATCDLAPLAYGDNSTAVYDMQQHLYNLGYLDYEPEGYFGWFTYIAVREFQMFNALPVTGDADVRTLEVLYSSAAESFFPLEYGMAGPITRTLQELLVQAGCLEGTCDGEYGNMTYEAVLQFQYDNEIYPASGTAGRLTIDTLLGLYSPWSDPQNPGETPDVQLGTADGAPEGTPAQDGAIISGGTYIISAALGSGVLDVAGDSTDDGANVQLYDLTYSSAQKWVVQAAGSGYYLIRNLHSWKCLDAYDFNAQQSEYTGAASQLWYFEETADGYYHIINANGLYLGDSNWNVSAGFASGSYSQEWALSHVSSDTALDFESDGTQYIGIRSFDISAGNVTETSYYYNIGTSIYLPSGGYYLSGGDNYSIGLKVMYVNTFLANAGYLSGEYYNYNRYDWNTVAAVTQFQQDHGLEADGVVGLETWLAMGLSEYDFYYLGAYTTPLKVYAYGSSRDTYVEAMIATAEEYLYAGTGYSDGASGKPGTYVDCSGLIFQCLYAAGINPDVNIIDHARVVYEYTSNNLGHDYQMGEPVDVAERGDLVFYGGSDINHVAIYVGDGMIIDSWPGLGVSKRSIWAPGNILKIIRVF